MWDWIRSFQLVCSVLSIIGPLLIFLVFISMKNRKNFALQLVVLIALSDMVLSLADVLNAFNQVTVL